jgi:beta-xylosidase|tara:strand:+ start:1556 stop:1753 length:198 start_codon:yes stop_codon:yes gene_type:complete
LIDSKSFPYNTAAQNFWEPFQEKMCVHHLYTNKAAGFFAPLLFEACKQIEDGASLNGGLIANPIY